MDSKSLAKLHQGKPHDNTVADESCQSPSTPKIDLAAKNTEAEESTSRMLNPLVNKLPHVNPHNNTVADESTDDVNVCQPNNNTVANESSSSEKSQVPHVLGFDDVSNHVEVERKLSDRFKLNSEGVFQVKRHKSVALDQFNDNAPSRPQSKKLSPFPSDVQGHVKSSSVSNIPSPQHQEHQQSSLGSQFLGHGLVHHLASLTNHKVDKANLANVVNWMLSENLIVAKNENHDQSFQGEKLYSLQSKSSKPDEMKSFKKIQKIGFNKSIDEVLDDKENDHELMLKKIKEANSIENERLKFTNKELQERLTALESKLDRLNSLRSTEKLKTSNVKKCVQNYQTSLEESKPKQSSLPP